MKEISPRTSQTTERLIKFSLFAHNLMEREDKTHTLIVRRAALFQTCSCVPGRVWPACKMNCRRAVVYLACSPGVLRVAAGVSERVERVERVWRAGGERRPPTGLVEYDACDCGSSAAARGGGVEADSGGVVLQSVVRWWPNGTRSVPRRRRGESDADFGL